MIQRYEIKIDNERFNQGCMEALTTLPEISFFSRQVDLVFSLENQPQGNPEHLGMLIYDAFNNKLSMSWAAFSGKQTNLRLETDNESVKKFAVNHLSEIFKQGYSISKGEVILARYCPSHCPGAGYDYVLDEDDYEESKFEIIQPVFKLRLAEEMPQEPRDKVYLWFCELQKQFSLD